MCGRFTRTTPRAVLVDEFGVEHFVEVDFAPRYNIAPSQNIEAIINDGTELRMGPMLWGFTTSGREARTDQRSRRDRCDHGAVL